MNIYFNNDNITLPITLNNKILNVVSNVRGLFSDKNIYSSISNITTDKSTISVVGARLIPGTGEFNYNTISGFVVIIGY